MISWKPEFIEVGRSDSPGILLRPLGVDFHNPKFWQKGFDEIRNLVEHAQELAEKIKGSITQ